MHRFIPAMVLFLFVSAVYGQTTDQLLKQLKDPEPRLRRIAAEKLGRLKVEKASAEIAELLKDKDEDVRQAAARSSVKLNAVPELAMFGPKAKSALPKIRLLLDDDNDNETIAEAAAEALEKISVPTKEKPTSRWHNWPRLGSFRSEPGIGIRDCVDRISDVLLIQLPAFFR